MKKLFFLASVVLCLLAAHSVSAQKIGGFLAYGSEIESLGIGVNGEFNVAQKLTISPSFVFYFPNNDVTWLELNGNLNYYLLREGIDFYGLAGLNLAILSYASNSPYYEGGSNSEIGLNLGFGVNFDVGQSFKPFAEMKYTISDFDQLGIFFGLKFNLK